MAMQKQQPLVIQPGAAGTSRRSRSAAASSIRNIDINALWVQARKTLKGQYVVLATSNLLLALILSLVVSQALQRSFSDLDTINTGSIPSVDAAQAMAQYIEDIDAKAADYLATSALTTTEQCSIVGTNRNPGALTVHDCDDHNIDAEIILVNEQLFKATHNVTYPGEQTAVERITAGFEEYVADIMVMRHEYALAKSKTDPQDVHLQSAYQAYLAASNVLHQHISLTPIVKADGSLALDEQKNTTLPTCVVNGRVLDAQTWALGSIEDNITCLNNINKAHLDAAYDDTLSFLNTTTTVALGLCIVFWLLLLFTIGRMVVTTHRVINIGLSLAMVTSLVFGILVVNLFGEMSGRHGAFGQMVKDDYDSIYAAALLKRYGTEANGDESRWLIALEFGNQTDVDHWYQDWLANTNQVTTLMKQAKANRTWPEEDQPLADMQTYWNKYFSIDGQIRQKAQDKTDANRVIAAEVLSTGDSNRAFDSFSQAVDQLSTAN